MRKIKFLLIILCVIHFNSGIAQNNDTVLYTAITQVLNDDDGIKEAEKICEILDSKGIKCVIIGSLGLTINVPKKDLTKAQALLQNAIDKAEIDVEIYYENEGWPKDVQGLIEHLNKWDKNELDVFERPDAYPNIKSSGETNGWVEEHKRQIEKLGAKIIWDSQNLKYELSKTDNKK
jgi:hypothetical protein